MARKRQELPTIKKSILIFLEKPCRQRNSLCIFTEIKFWLERLCNIWDLAVERRWKGPRSYGEGDNVPGDLCGQDDGEREKEEEEEEEEEDVEYKEEQELFEA